MGLNQKVKLGSEVTGILPAGQVQGGGAVPYVVDTGTANNYVVALSPPIVAYTPGLAFDMQIGHLNTGVSVISVNGLGNVSIVTNAGVALSGGELPANGVVRLQFQGTYFIIAIAAITITPSTAALGTGTANSSTFLRGDRTWAAPVAAAPPEVILQQRVTQNSNGDSLTAGSQNVRGWAIVSDPSSLGSVSSNKLTLVAGTYVADIDCTTFAVDATQSYLFNFTDSAVVTNGEGLTGRADGAANGCWNSVIRVRFTTDGTKAYQLITNCATSYVQGGGRAGNFREEIYVNAVFRKVG